MEQQYFFFYLMIALKSKKDLHVYAYENVSHVPTKKLIEILEIDLSEDPQISNAYFLTKKKFKKHKSFIKENFVPLNFKVFEYAIQCYTSNNPADIRKMYKESVLE